MPAPNDLRTAILSRSSRPARAPKHALAVLVVCLAALPAIATAGSVYRWRAADGVITYGERPPVGVEATRVTTYGAPRSANTTSDAGAGNAVAATGNPQTATAGSGTSTSTATAQRSAAQQKLDGELAATEQERLAEVARVRAENCTRARELFDQLTQFARLRVEDESGQTRILTEEERKQRVEDVRADMVEYCS